MAMGHNQADINTENMGKIKKIIKQASIKAYSLYKKWEMNTKREQDAGERNQNKQHKNKIGEKGNEYNIVALLNVDIRGEKSGDND